MAYCRKCGSKLADNDNYCQSCGTKVNKNETDGQKQTAREQYYSGVIYKCPNCGDVIPSFHRNCPRCGFELRETKASSAVKEFARKIEELEALRKEEKSHSGFFDKVASISTSSSIDKQIISLIKNFTVPNTKEDLLEFMILATSNIEAGAYNQYNGVKPRKLELNEAWLSKAKQVYQKAKSSYGNEKDFGLIQELYNNCKGDINKEKNKGFKTLLVLIIVVVLLMAGLFLGARGYAKTQNKKEYARMELLEKESKDALNNGEYKKALLNAEGLVFNVYTGDDDAKGYVREWNIKREVLINEIIEKALKDGIVLEHISEGQEDNIESDDSSGDTTKGFLGGFVDGIKGGMEGINQGVESFKQSMDEIKNSDVINNYADK